MESKRDIYFLCIHFAMLNILLLINNLMYLCNKKDYSVTANFKKNGEKI